MPTTIELEIPSLAPPAAATTPEEQVWRLLCASTLAELDPNIEGVHADDLATALHGLGRYRALGPQAAAYLWFADETAEPRAPDA
jgi:hypothetical protein